MTVGKGKRVAQGEKRTSAKAERQCQHRRALGPRTIESD